MGKDGVSLIELLAATALVIIVMSSLSLFFPKASKAAIMNRYVTTAKNLVTGKIQAVKQDPYTLVQLTPTASFLAAGNQGVFPANGCDCALENPDNYPISDTLDDHGITFTRRVCTNLIYRNGANWSAYCPDGT